MVKLKSFGKKFEIDELKNKSDLNLVHPKRHQMIKRRLLLKNRIKI